MARSINKRASLFYKSLWFVVGLLCLVLLYIFGAKVLSLLITNTEIEQARGSLDKIVSKINTLEEGESLKILVDGPKKWFIVPYVKGEEMPSSCKGENCLCFCEEFDNCNVGVCKKMKYSMEVTQTIDISGSKKMIIYPAPVPLFLNLNNDILEISINYLDDGEVQDLFNNFLNSEYEFLNQGKKTIREQIIYYVNSVERTRDIMLNAVYRGDEDAMKALEQNIENYFSDYEFSIWVKIENKEEGYQGPSILSVATGKDNDGGTDAWPTFLINNPDGKIKDILVHIVRRTW